MLWATVALQLAIVMAADAAEKVVEHRNGALGFQISPPVRADFEGPAYLVAYFFLPPRKDFSANVNVIVQKHGGSIREYLKLSEQQLRQKRLTVAKRTVKSDHELHLEYEGRMEGRMMQFVARVLLRKGRVFLVTGTVLKDDPEGRKKAIRDSVMSFRLTSEAKPVSPVPATQ